MEYHIEYLENQEKSRKIIMIIVIEGIDGVGKGTQSKRLVERFQKEGKNCKMLSFPVYDSFFGKMIGQYLNGSYGELDQIHPQQASLLYALDRWETFKNINPKELKNNALIIDRYVSSNMAHQGAKAPKEKRTELINWIEELEYNRFNLPQPNLVIVLDADTETTSQQVLKKDARSYTNKAMDIHEQDENYLQKVRHMYQDLSEKHKNFTRIQCLGPKGMRSIEDIHSEIWNLVSAHPLFETLN